MKKRIVSLLLLAAMIVTALPLAVLPSLAAEGEDTVKGYDEAEYDSYNKLYVTDSLLLGADFYKMNEYWNPNGAIVYEVPVGPSDTAAYVYNGVTYDFTDATTIATVKSGLASRWASASNPEGVAFLAAVAAWRADYVNFMNDNFVWASTGMKFTYYNNMSDPAKERSPLAAADGYMQFVKNYHTSGGLTFTGLATTSAATMQIVSAFDTTRSTWYPFLWHHVKFSYKLSTAETKNDSVAVNSMPAYDNSTWTLSNVATENLPKTNKVYAYTEAISLTSGDDTFYAATQIGKLADATGTYRNNATTLTNGDFHMGWGETIYNTKLYAYREYADVLTAEEIAQNHFADLVKWYRVDMDLIDLILNRIPEAERYEKVYSKFTGFFIDAEDKEAIEALLVGILTPLLAGRYEDTALEIYDDVAAKYLLDLADLLANPKGMYPNAYKVLNTLLAAYPETVPNASADYKAALEADYAAAWDSFDWTYEQYNELYAAQDAAVLSLDFFKTNPIWNQSIALPTAPAETTDYVYNGVTYDFTKIENRLVEADENKAILVKKNGTAVGYAYLQKNGVPSYGVASYPGGSAWGDYRQTMPRKTYTAAEAEAVLANLKARTGSEWGNGTFTYDIVDVSLWMIWRTGSSGVKTAYTDPAARVNGVSEWNSSSTKVVQVFATKAEAEATLATLTKESGYTYEVAVRPIITSEYYQCVLDYAAKVVSDCIYPADMAGGADRTGLIAFTQNMKTVGEVSYQTPDGIHSYTGVNAMKSHVSFENGYLLLDSSDSGPYFNVNGVKATGDYFLDTVMAGGAKETKNSGGTIVESKVVQFRGQNVMIKVTASGTSLYSVGDVSAASNLVSGPLTPFRLTIASKDLGNGKATVQTVVDGVEVIGADKSVTPGTAGLMGHSHSDDARIYTYRIYDRILTAEEQAQNHFADIAKYFKLNLIGYDDLDAEGKAAVWNAVADLSFDATRLEAQNAVNAVLNAEVKAAYGAMAAEYPAYADFIALACEYRIDIADALKNGKAMIYVKDLTFDELSYTEAQARFDEAYSDAARYLVHRIDGQDAWNEWLVKMAEVESVESIDALLSLPFAEKVGVALLENNVDKAVIEAYIAEVSAKYENAALPEYDSYNALYVQDGLMLAADFFGSNQYWKISYELPLAPSDNTAYLYDADGDGETESYDLTNATARATKITAEGDKNKDKTVFAVAKDEWQTAYRNYMNNTFRWATDGKMGFGVYGGASETMERAPFYLTDGGYVQFHENYPSGGGIVFTNVSNKLSAATAQLVLSLSKLNDSAATEPLLFHNVRTSVLAKNGVVSFKSFSGVSSIGGVHYAEVKLASGETFDHYAFYTSKMMESRALFSADAEAYAAKLTDEAVDGSVYFAEKKDVATYYIYKQVGEKDTFASGVSKNTDAATKDVLVATWYLRNEPDGKYVLATDPDITYAYDEVFALTQSIQLKDGDDHFMFRTEDGLVGEINAPYNGSDTVLDENTHYVGWGTAHKHMKVYAFRQYSRVLSDAEIAQNHFADLAKFYRLDLAGYNMLTDVQKAAAHAAFTAYGLGEQDRDVLQAALTEECRVLYDGMTVIEGDAEANAAFIALAATATLDLSAIMAISPADRAAFAYAMLADFDPAYANGAIIAYHYNERTYTYAAMTFAGYQVRLDSGSALANYAGVRAVFDINEAAIAAIIERNGGAPVTLTVSVTGEATVTTTIVYTVVEGVLTATGADIYERGEGKSVNILVAYKGEEITKENLLLEYGFDYTIAVGDAATAFEANSATFGDKVSAAEVYGYFYDNGYAEDSVVAGVKEALTSILVKTPEEAQAALDNATPGTIIRLAEGVEYGVLYLRPVAGQENTITDCDHLVYRNEMLRKVEDLTIKGADGATIDAIVVIAGFIEGSTGYLADIKNLVIDSVTFNDTHTNASHKYAAPLFFDLTYTNVDGLTVKNCELIGDNDLMNFVYFYDSGDVSATFETAAKNIALIGNTVDGIARLCELRQTENVTITGNVIKNTDLHAILLTVKSGVFSGDVIITDNAADGIGDRFVRMAGAGDANVVIKDNVITNYLGEDADFIKVTDSTGTPIIENNILVP